LTGRPDGRCFPTTSLSGQRNTHHTTTALEIVGPNVGRAPDGPALVALGGAVAAAEHALADLCARYELEMRPDGVPELAARFGLKFPGEPV
jgi:hypothetical protein